MIDPLLSHQVHIISFKDQKYHTMVVLYYHFTAGISKQGLFLIVLKILFPFNVFHFILTDKESIIDLKIY